MSARQHVRMHRVTVIAVVILLSALLPVGAVSAQESPSSPGPSASPPPAAPTAPVTDGAALAFKDPAWSAIKPSNSPAAREDHTWTADGESRFAYLFGARDGAEAFGDLWRFDLAADSWQRLSPRGKAPTPRFGHNAVWVDGHGLIIFAGQRGADLFDDLWVYEPDTNAWR